MRNLLKIIFGSCLGTILAILAIGFLSSVIASFFVSRGSTTPAIKPNSVLKIAFEKPIPEKTNNLQQAQYAFGEELYLGTYDIIKSIRAAKDDRNIKGIYMNIRSGSIGRAKAAFIREALRDFKESGKFVYAYSGDYGYTQSAYHLATIADQVSLHPLGVVDLRGFGAEIPFFKDMLDKIGIKMRAFYVGKYKGATEPYRRNDLSEENRYQIKTYLNEQYKKFVADIAEGRGLSESLIRKSANELDGRRASLALDAGLVDGLKYEDEVLDDLREQLDLDDDEKVPLMTLENYHRARKKSRNLGAGAKIAVVHAEGVIQNGDETYGLITDDHYVKMIRDIGEDEKVRAIVLRVNSPGGDAFVSDEIWRALEQLQEKDIKVVASMGDVAASGGYYISCGADKIVAQPSTITGSIGVFGVIPNMSELLNDKMGIHTDTVKTARYASGLASPFSPIGENEAAIIQESVDHTYEVFLSRVAEGREMSRDAVHEIAQGRVWTGNSAVEKGLVDELGTLEDAINIAADLAGIDDYRITEYPRIKDPVQKLIEDLSSGKLVEYAGEQMWIKQYPETAKLLENLEILFEARRPLALLPFQHIN